MPNTRSGFLTPNNQQPIGNYGQQRKSLWDRIGGALSGVGRGIGAVGGGITDMLSAAGGAYAPNDLELTKMQQIGLLGRKLREMEYGPGASTSPQVQPYLDQIRAGQTRTSLTDAINALDISDQEKALLMAMPPAEQFRFIQAYPERQRQQESQERILGLLGQGSVGPGIQPGPQPGLLNLPPGAGYTQQPTSVPQSRPGLAGNDPLFQAMIREQVQSGDTSGALQNMYNMRTESQAKRGLLDALGGMGYSEDFIARAQGLGSEGIRSLMETENTRLQEEDNRTFARGTTLRNEFLRGAGDFEERQDKFGQIMDFAIDPSAAGDIAMVFAYMKLLDPSSVVRESEYATAASAGPLVDAYTVGVYNRLLAGQRLTPIQRADFLKSAGELYDNAAQSFERHRGAYETQATNAGLQFDRDVYSGDLRRFYDEDMPTEDVYESVRAHVNRSRDGENDLESIKTQLQRDGQRAIDVERILADPGGDAELMGLGFATRQEAQEFLDYFIENAKLVDPDFLF